MSPTPLATAPARPNWFQQRIAQDLRLLAWGGWLLLSLGLLLLGWQLAAAHGLVRPLPLLPPWGLRGGWLRLAQGVAGLGVAGLALLAWRSMVVRRDWRRSWRLRRYAAWGDLERVGQDIAADVAQPLAGGGAAWQAGQRYLAINNWGWWSAWRHQDLLWAHIYHINSQVGDNHFLKLFYCDRKTLLNGQAGQLETLLGRLRQLCPQALYGYTPENAHRYQYQRGELIHAITALPAPPEAPPAAPPLPPPVALPLAVMPPAPASRITTTSPTRREGQAGSAWLRGRVRRAGAWHAWRLVLVGLLGGGVVFAGLYFELQQVLPPLPLTPAQLAAIHVADQAPFRRVTVPITGVVHLNLFQYPKAQTGDINWGPKKLGQFRVVQVGELSLLCCTPVAPGDTLTGTVEKRSDHFTGTTLQDVCAAAHCQLSPGYDIYLDATGGDDMQHLFAVILVLATGAYAVWAYRWWRCFHDWRRHPAVQRCATWGELDQVGAAIAAEFAAPVARGRGWVVTPRYVICTGAYWGVRQHRELTTSRLKFTARFARPDRCELVLEFGDEACTLPGPRAELEQLREFIHAQALAASQQQDRRTLLG